MKKDALFHNDPFSSSEKTALFSFDVSGNSRALFRQNRVAVLTKDNVVCHLCHRLLPSVKDQRCDAYSQFFISPYRCGTWLGHCLQQRFGF